MGKRLFPQTLGAPGVALEKMGTINKLSEETNKFKIDKNLGGDSKNIPQNTSQKYKLQPKLMNFFGTVSQHYLTFEELPVSPTALIQFNFLATNTFPAEPESFASATDITMNE